MTYRVREVILKESENVISFAPREFEVSAPTLEEVEKLAVEKAIECANRLTSAEHDWEVLSVDLVGQPDGKKG